MFKKYLLNDSRPVKPRYKYPFLFFPFVCMMASFVVLHVVVVWLASIWHISMNTPGRGPADGLPDGMCVDDTGGLWSCIYRGGAVHRYTPDGVLDTVVTLPVPCPTSLAFGGPHLDRLFITTGGGTGKAQLVGGGRIVVGRSGHHGSTGYPLAGSRGSPPMVDRAQTETTSADLTGLLATAAAAARPWAAMPPGSRAGACAPSPPHWTPPLTNWCRWPRPRPSSGRPADR